MKYAPPLIVLLLIVIAVVLGYAIYDQSTSRQASTSKSSQPSIRPQQTVPSSNSASKSAELTADEKIALQTPGPNSTEEQKKNHFDAALRAAKKGSTLDIGGCKGNPVVLRVQNKGKMTFNNPDGVDHNLIIDSEHKYLIPANSKKEITIDFGKGGGLYGYGCDEAVQATGLLLVGQ